MKKNWVNLFVAILLFIPLRFLQVSIDYHKKLEDLETGVLLMPGQMAGSLVLSGFKGLAADLLWLNVEEYWHSGQHYKMLPLLEAVAWLQPTYVTVWAVGGWHMAYNIYVQAGQDEGKISEQLEKIQKDWSPSEQEKYRAISEAVKANKTILEQLDKKGKTEELVRGYLASLEKHETKITALAEKESGNKAVELVNTLLAIPRNKIFWYQQGVQFLKKGITYNPDKYDLYFELGWTYYHKGMDYPNAVKYLEKAIKHPHPDYVDDVLAHAYEKNGQIDKAIAQWEYLMKIAPSFKGIAERMIHDLKTKGKATP
ncbi:MAG: hypothetical protein NC911_01215 [Candidatus Omnitrophica bacterium]|nr:hypothetical protein [Candidatus Omnitrophota bacterium]